MPTTTDPTTRPAALVVEVRPGEGGADAATFAAELADALTAYIRRLGADAALEPGAARTTLIHVTGPARIRAAVDDLTGTHRVQRVPTGDKHGRRHTSTATVAVLGATRHVRVNVDDADIEWEAFRGTGPGGQHRNKTSTAIRLRHRPTGIVITRTSGRSQAANLADARVDLHARLLERAAGQARTRRNDDRLAQIGDAQRPAKTFTHNTQRDETTCHATGRRWRMSAFLRGRIDS